MIWRMILKYLEEPSVVGLGFGKETGMSLGIFEVSELGKYRANWLVNFFVMDPGYSAKIWSRS